MDYKNHYSLREWIELGRKDVLDLFSSEEYGFIPKELDIPLKYEVAEEKYTDTIHIRKVLMFYKNYPMRFYLYVPKGRKHNKTFIMVMHEYAENLADKDLVNNYQSFYKYADIDNIISRGYAIALVATREVYPDKKYSHRNSILKAAGIRKKSNTAGALRLWAWACSKVLDYLYTLGDEIDTSKVAVIGHSRGGKTALIAASYDERFVLSVSSCSGNSGAALSRNNTGETIADINKNFPYWFSKKYRNYSHNEDKLPFDQHQLIGLIAPRYVYVFSASEDSWACPKNELLSCRYASDYFKLYGLEGLAAPQQIKNDVSYSQGHIAYHMKTGSHSLEMRDWNMVMDYFDKIN